MEKIGRVTYIGIYVGVLTLLMFNTLSWRAATIGIPTAIAYLAFTSFIIGSITVPHPTGAFAYSRHAWALLFGLLILLSGVATLGALAIATTGLSDAIFLAIAAGVPALAYRPYFLTAVKQGLRFRERLVAYFKKFTERREPRVNTLLVVTYGLLMVLAALFLYAGQTLRSIQAPWQTVPDQFFLVYFLATTVLCAYLLTARRQKLPLALLITHALLSFSVASVVYVLGYGYDPFIHQATERIIAATGTITPTPLYYLGQYGIVVFIHKLSLLDLTLIDRLLVPVLAALFISTFTFFVFSHWFSKRFALLLSLAMLTIPFGGYIMTTPQNLANLWFLLTILLSLLYFRGKFSGLLLWLMAASTLAIHPIAGIPLLLTILLFQLFRTLYDSYAYHRVPYLLAALALSVALPLAFTVNGAQLSIPSLRAVLSAFLPSTPPVHFDLALDIVYALWAYRVVIAAGILALGAWQLWRRNLLRNHLPYFAAGVVILLNFIFIRLFLDFPELHAYDQVAFTGRLGLLLLYALLPIFLFGLYVIVSRIAEQGLPGKIFLVLLLSGGVAASLYLSYPRLDSYGPAKFFSVSSSDIKAVRLIEQIAPTDHVVLANQMLGAAAIQEFGFKRYYDGQFYYSSPNGSPRTLYDAYLSMVEQGAKKETMRNVMDATNVGTAYFVLNRYWNNSRAIAEQANLNADAVYSVDDGTVIVNEYRRN